MSYRRIRVLCQDFENFSGDSLVVSHPRSHVREIPHNFQPDLQCSRLIRGAEVIFLPIAVAQIQKLSNTVDHSKPHKHSARTLPFSSNIITLFISVFNPAKSSWHFFEDLPRRSAVPCSVLGPPKA